MLDLGTGTVTELMAGGGSVRYVASGHLVFPRVETLWAAPFDLGQWQLTGDSFPTNVSVRRETRGRFTGLADFSVSEAGTLLYVQAGDSRWTELRPVLVDRQGRERGLPIRSHSSYGWPRLSPDGQRVLFSSTPVGASSTDLWVADIESGDEIRLTTQVGEDNMGEWLPAGDRVVFRSLQDGTVGIYIAVADGSRDPELFAPLPALAPLDVSPDGRWGLAWTGAGAAPGDTSLVSMEDGTHSVLVSGAVSGSVSPSGTRQQSSPPPSHRPGVGAGPPRPGGC